MIVVSVETNKELVRRFYEAIEREDYGALKEFAHPDFVFYPQIDTPFYGAEGLVESEKKNFDAFPGFKMPVQSIFAKGDQVAVYLIFEGKHTGIPLMGVQATGKDVRFSLMMLLRIADGKIVEKRSHVNVHDVIRQISDHS